MMQIVKLDIGRITCLKHFHLDKGSDALDMVRIQSIEKAKHQLPPGPESVPRIGAPPFGQPCHGALERVRMDVGWRRKQYADYLSLGRRICGDRTDYSIEAGFDTNRVGPAV